MNDEVSRARGANDIAGVCPYHTSSSSSRKVSCGAMFEDRSGSDDGREDVVAKEIGGNDRLGNDEQTLGCERCEATSIKEPRMRQGSGSIKESKRTTK